MRKQAFLLVRMIFLVALATSLVPKTVLAERKTEEKKITVIGSSVQGHVTLIEATIDAQNRTLECFLERNGGHACQVLKAGEFIMADNPKGIYTDCSNVTIYALLTTNSSVKKGRRKGEYCLLPISTE